MVLSHFVHYADCKMLSNRADCVCRTLNVANCRFGGDIPPNVWLLPSLQTIILANNSFTGNILPTIGNVHTLM